MLAVPLQTSVIAMNLQTLNSRVLKRFNEVVAQFLLDLAEQSEGCTFKDLADEYLPHDNVEKYESMKHLRELTIKELRFALARRNNCHLSGSKDVLIQRLWKLLHPAKRDPSEKIEYIEWSKKQTDPESWPAIWVHRKGSTGIVIKNPWDSMSSDVQKPAILLRVDLSYEPPLAFSETVKEYILEGEYDPKSKQVLFGNVPDRIEKTLGY